MAQYDASCSIRSPHATHECTPNSRPRWSCAEPAHRIRIACASGPASVFLPVYAEFTALQETFPASIRQSSHRASLALDTSVDYCHLRVLEKPQRSSTRLRFECASRALSHRVHYDLVTAQFLARCPFWLHRKQTLSPNGVRSLFFAPVSLVSRGGLARFSLEAYTSLETRVSLGARTTPNSCRRCAVA